MKELTAIPIPVKRILRGLGLDIRTARLRRRITMQLMAERAGISRTTLAKVEKGDPSVTMGIYASILFVLGLLPNFETLFSGDKDRLGKMLEEEQLPKRIRLPPTH